MIVGNYRETLDRIFNEERYPDDCNWNAHFLRLLELNGLHLVPWYENPYHGTVENPFAMGPWPAPYQQPTWPRNVYIVPIGWEP